MSKWRSRLQRPERYDIAAKKRCLKKEMKNCHHRIRRLPVSRYWWVSVSVRQTERTASRQRSEPPGWQPCHMLYSYYFVASGNGVESNECREICKSYLIKSSQTCRIPLSDTELGGHFVGCGMSPYFTTRNLTPLGINPRASLAPAVQTHKVQSAS